ncbi:PAN-1 domain and Apple-like domain-containing protein [Strongyloides ratti]|uniref:PAN-1 domain and Apple-like domain-containing protein n=1 Tax=Strongyloides ratti TaxID=34506 RepID=A0A090LBK0_STRRB|nr:PAN-1 domain and Apple-like domain-containing protein [Strongyloides ratti]CEF65508.1 PAN-1 domain and Apple-like domain-containing protein [Strongyloides ratti]
MKKIFFLLLFIYHIFGENSFNRNSTHKRRRYRKKPKYVSEGASFLPTIKPYTDNVDKIITEIADISDSCFKKFSHTTIFNSQSFERKSGISLDECKKNCFKNIKYSLRKRIDKSYKCQSIVYNEGICDLYNHLGDEAPSILVRLNNSHYFEPSMTKLCIEGEKINESKIIKLKEIPRRNHIYNSIEDQIIENSFHPIIIETPSEIRRKESLLSKSNTLKKDFPPPRHISMDVKKKDFQKTCEYDNKVESYLKVSGFELFDNNKIILENTNYEECANICNYNKINDKQVQCKSFDLFQTTCLLSSESAVPLGNKQLKKNLASNYYEKICVEKNLIKNCQNVFERYPQKILVGYAEMVLDSSTFEECFNSCLKAEKLFGFHCKSGMYYFEEKTLNCILNTESKNTQTILFTDELNDIVDYFETGCINNKVIEDNRNQKEFRKEDLIFKDKSHPKRDMDEGTLLVTLPSKEMNKEFLKNMNPKWIVVQ